MNYFRTYSAKKRFIFTATRGGFCILILLLYITLWRPARIYVTKDVVYPQVTYLSEYNYGFTHKLQNGVLVVEYFVGDNVKELNYRPEFGFFFLIVLMTCIFITQHPKHYGLLLGLHLIGSVLAYLCLIIAVTGGNLFFIFVDIISRYLIPALSLLFIPLVINREI